ncbi:MAG: hypothetical protein J2P48_22975 [Alphaproteobacteria bacterium]|nr:hypothetical protein [Alphaproteobacteria bacterium]
MYDQTIDAPPALRVGHHRLRSGLALIPLLAALGVVLFTTLGSPLKDDVAWLLYVARQWLAGRQLYVDLVEINPPMIVWILALPAGLSAALDVPVKFVAVPFFAGCMLGCAGWCAKLLRGYGPPGSAPVPVFAVVGTVLLVLPGPEFGQREHLLVAASLPYLCIFARSLDGAPTRPADEIIAGILAAFGCALKPQFLLAFGLLEIVGRMHGVRLVRRMTIGLAITMLGYIAALCLFYPAYLTSAIPLGLALYGVSDVGWSQLLSDGRPVLVAGAIALLLWWANRRKMSDSALPLTLAVFAAGSIFVWLLEEKAWFYHRLPACILTTLALVYWVSALPRPQMGRRAAFFTAIFAAAALLGIGFGAFSRWHDQLENALGARLMAERRLEQLIHTERARSYIAFSQWIGLGFPVVNNTGVHWSSRFDSMWALAGELWRRRIDGHLPRDWPIHSWVVEDFLAGCPDLAVVDEREGADYVGTLSSFDPRFRDAWSRYRQIAAFDGLRVFRRQASSSAVAGLCGRHALPHRHG